MGAITPSHPGRHFSIVLYRLGWLLHALDLYRRMKQRDPSPLEHCSPSEVRRLLYQLLCESRMLQLNHNGGSEKAAKDMQRELKEPRLSVYQGHNSILLGMS